MNQYRLLRRLGRGGFGEVFEAQRSGVCDGERVAIKRLYKERNGASSMDRIRSEIASHRGLLHENIVRLTGTFEDSEFVYLVLEFCEGGTLYNALERRESPFDERTSIDLFLQLLSGLSYLHQRGIVHRDIKLSNLFLTKEGVLKIGDFGLSVRANSLVDDRAVGTVEYMDSDILSGFQRSYLPEMDLWCAGCVLYSLMTRNSPFKTSDPTETIQRILSFDYDLPGHLSASAVEILTHLLCSSRFSRWNIPQCLQSDFLRPIVEAQSRSISSVDSLVVTASEAFAEQPASEDEEAAKEEEESALSDVQDVSESLPVELQSVLPSSATRILDLTDLPDMKRATSLGSIEVKDRSLLYRETEGRWAVRVHTNGYQCVLCSPTSSYPCTLRSVPPAQQPLLHRMLQCFHCLLSIVPRVACSGPDDQMCILMSNPITPDFQWKRNGVSLHFHNRQGAVTVDSDDLSLQFALPGRRGSALCSRELCSCPIPARPAPLLALPSDPNTMTLIGEGLKRMRSCLRLERERMRGGGAFPCATEL